jgi:hypothetical protein
METAIFAAMMALSVGGYFYGQRKAKQEVERRFLGREHLDIERVCDLFCEGEQMDRQVAKELIEHVAGELSVSSSLLRPTDRFAFELKPPRGWNFDSARSTLLLDLKRLAKKSRRTVDTASITTLLDYVRTMAKVY